ncbi:MAG TPA: SRPBCC family protein [Nitrospiraceae bacterium]|nr:SRPBCC family protein [Nitrospiraceae bacterium]
MEQRRAIPERQLQAARRASWSSTARLMTGTAGGALALYGASRRGLPGAAAAIVGLGLLGQALRKGGLRRLFGIEPRQQRLDIQKAITIRAPADRVFDFWTKYGHTASFMRNVRATRMMGNGRSLWTVIRPSGAPMGWDANLVTQRPSKWLAWKTTGDAAIRHTGTVRFIDHDDGTTTVDLKITFYPSDRPALGRSVPPDIKTLLAQDLTRMKIAIESGIVPVEDRQAFRGERTSRIALQAS